GVKSSEPLGLRMSRCIDHAGIQRGQFFSPRGFPQVRAQPRDGKDKARQARHRSLSKNVSFENNDVHALENTLRTTRSASSARRPLVLGNFVWNSSSVY